MLFNGILNLKVTHKTIFFRLHIFSLLSHVDDAAAFSSSYLLTRSFQTLLFVHLTHLSDFGLNAVVVVIVVIAVECCYLKNAARVMKNCCLWRFYAVGNCIRMKEEGNVFLITTAVAFDAVTDVMMTFLYTSFSSPF